MLFLRFSFVLKEKAFQITSFVVLLESAPLLFHVNINQRNLAKRSFERVLVVREGIHLLSRHCSWVPPLSAPPEVACAVAALGSAVELQAHKNENLSGFSVQGRGELDFELQKRCSKTRIQNQIKKGLKVQ